MKSYGADIEPPAAKGTLHDALCIPLHAYQSNLDRLRRIQSAPPYPSSGRALQALELRIVVP